MHFITNSNQPSGSRAPKNFLRGGGECGELVRRINWSAHPLGHPDSWPGSMKTALNILFNSLQPSCLLWGQEQFFFYNDAFLPILGESKHPSSMGTQSREVWAEIWPMLQPRLELTLNKGRAFWSEDQPLPLRRARGNGDSFFTYSCSPVFLESGIPGGALVTCTETTARVLTERKLQESQKQLTLAMEMSEVERKRFESLFDACPAILAMLKGPDFIYEKVNSAYTRITGCSPIGRPAREVISKKDAALYLGVLEKVYRTGESALLRNVPVSPEENPANGRYFDVYYTRVSNGEGCPYSVYTYAMETTERVRAHRKIQETETYFRSLIDNSPAMIWITDTSGRFDYRSKKWFDFTGESPETDLNAGWLNDIHPDDRDQATGAFHAATTNRRPLSIEYRLRCSGGGYRWVMDLGYPRFDGHGEYAGYIGTVIHNHQQKELQLQLAEAVRSRDEFLSVASHELRTPLSSLKLQAQLQNLQFARGDAGALNPENLLLKNFSAQRQLDRLSRLIDDMLDVSRIASGMLSLELEEIDLCELARTTVPALSELASGSQRASVRVEAGEPIFVKGDAFRLDQVFANLVSNALKYGRSSPVSLRVFKRDGFARIEVSDQGLGIAAENLERIFERFERAVSPLHFRGLGLGLYITRQIVTLHNGRVWAESAPGKGSTFVVELPLSAR